MSSCAYAERRASPKDKVVSQPCGILSLLALWELVHMRHAQLRSVGYRKRRKFWRVSSGMAFSAEKISIKNVHQALKMYNTLFRLKFGLLSVAAQSRRICKRSPPKTLRG